MKLACPLVLFAVCTGLSGCGGSVQPKPAPAAQRAPSAEVVLAPDAQGIGTVVVERKEIPDYLEVSGRIQADPTHVIRVFPPVGGRVIAVEVRPG